MSMFKRRAVTSNTRAAKSQPLAVRGFAAAQTDRLLSGWAWDGGFSAMEIRSQLAVIRARSREMAKNASSMKRFLDLVDINIVGEGFTLKSMPHDGVPGRDDYRLDQSAARFIEYHYWRWCNHRDPQTGRTWCDSTGRKNIAQIDSLCARTWARDGEYFIIKTITDANPYGFTLRVIRPDACDETHFREGANGENPIYCGVEIDRQTGRPLAYYFHSLDAESGIRGLRGPLVRIPAARVIHGFTQHDEDQPRGIPWSHAALVRMKMLDEYDRAELTAARDEACSVRKYWSKNPDAEDGIVNLLDPVNRDIAMALVAEKEPGQSEVLPMGWESGVDVPQHPNRNAEPFRSGMNKGIASGLGVEYSNAFNDWAGVSFSSVRVGTISERDMWIALQANMITQNKAPVFLAWLDMFLQLSISGALPYSKLEKFADHEYRGRRWMWVDPMKDMNAAKMAVENNWKTNTDVAADLGGDYGDNVETSKLESKLLAGDEKENVPILNGAQISAALEVIDKYATGQIGKEAAVGLLTASGVPSEAANNMVTKQKVKESTE